VYKKNTAATLQIVKGILIGTRLFEPITLEGDVREINSLSLVFKRSIDFFSNSGSFTFVGTYRPAGKDPVIKEYRRDVTRSLFDAMPPEVETWADWKEDPTQSDSLAFNFLDSIFEAMDSREAHASVLRQGIADFVLKFILDLQADGYLVNYQDVRNLP